MGSTRAKSVLRAITLVAMGMAIGVLATAYSLRETTRRGSQANANANRAALDQTIARLDLDNVPFDRAMEEIRQASGGTVVIDWEALRLSGFYLKSPVTLHCRYKSLRTLIEELSMQVPQGNPHPDFFASGGRIIVTSGSAVTDHFVVRIFDVRDLLPPRGLIGSTERDDYEQAVRNLMWLLKRTDPPQPWYSSGISISPGGTIDFFSGRLIVCQSEETQDDLQRFLESLRSAPPPHPSPEHGKSLSWSTSEATRAAEMVLNRPASDIHTGGATLDELMALLSHRCDVHFDTPVQFDDPALWNADTRFVVSVHAGTVGDVLDQMCSQPNEHGPRNYGVKGGSITWNPLADDGVFATRVYDVRDLLPANDPSYPAHTEPNPLVMHPGGVRDESAKRLIEKVASVLDRAHFGDYSDTFDACGGYLVISDTWLAHHRVERLLKSLRRQRN